MPKRTEYEFVNKIMATSLLKTSQLPYLLKQKRGRRKMLGKGVEGSGELIVANDDDDDECIPVGGGGGGGDKRV